MNKSRKRQLYMPLQFSVNSQLKEGERVGIPLGEITAEQKIARDAKNS